MSAVIATNKATQPKTPTPNLSSIRWMSPKQAAEYLQISLRTLQLKQAGGEMPFTRLGKKVIRFDREALDRFMGSKSINPS